MSHLEAILAQIDQQFPESLNRLGELLRFPSVGTDPGYSAACRDAASWLRQTLDGMGFAASIRETTGQPLVVGRYEPRECSSELPHVLFYGHYDVQPADPVELWESQPFEPQIRKGRDDKDQIFARGASDDKGQLMTFLEASRAWIAVTGRLPVRLSVMIEGDEEGDNTHLDRFLARNARDFAADAAFVCDTEMWGNDTPAICTTLRGCLSEEVTITGPAIDLHSGYYGGPAANPIKVLTRILAALHDARGRITIPGFYDGVKPIPRALRKKWAELGFSDKSFLGEVGLSDPAGERNYTALEQIWARPTAEINGIYGGYRGPGSKTVLPSEATAKLSFRLVEGQDPRAIRKAFQSFVKARLPKDCRARFGDAGGDSIAVRVADDTPWMAAAQRALAAEWGKEPVMIGCGASIPVVESFKRHLKIDSLLVGFARDDDNFHSPNEKYDVEHYRKGIRSWARIFAELA
ncbi:MAG: M20/M25/M40 family metallo-hydrolase [Alphaproteobacteria bacterium]|nr:M20/M25/M40 family metallo-hydrolase [Alphaproteobacteria bacterium]